MSKRILSNASNLQILYQDNHLLIVNKRIGDIVQGDKTNDKPLSEIAKEYIKNKFNKKGNVFLGVTHRLDRPTSGIVIFAKTSKALKRINKMFQNKEIPCIASCAILLLTEPWSSSTRRLIVEQKHDDWFQKRWPLPFCRQTLVQNVVKAKGAPGSVDWNKGPGFIHAAAFSGTMFEDNENL